jgi:hypothetical protein
LQPAVERFRSARHISTLAWCFKGTFEKKEEKSVEIQDFQDGDYLGLLYQPDGSYWVRCTRLCDVGLERLAVVEYALRFDIVFLDARLWVDVPQNSKSETRDSDWPRANHSQHVGLEEAAETKNPKRAIEILFQGLEGGDV